MEQCLCGHQFFNLADTKTSSIGPLSVFLMISIITMPAFNLLKGLSCIYLQTMAEEGQKKKKSPPIQILPNKQQLHFVGFGTYKIQDEETLTNLMRKGLQIGYCKHIDTARYYNNEIALGKAIKTVIAEDRCKRQDLFIATKSFNHIDSDPVLELKEALRLMQLDYVDIYYLHWPFVDMDPKGEKFLHRSLEECWAKFELCVKKGYTKHLGISNFNGQALTELLSICKIKPIILQIEIHPYLMQQSLVDVAQKNGLHVFAHTPLARGDSYKEELNILKDDTVQELSNKYGKTPGQIVLKTSLHRKIGVIPKTSNVARLQQNWQSWTVQLTEDDMKKVRNITKKLRICNGITSHLAVFDN